MKFGDIVRSGKDIEDAVELYRKWYADRGYPFDEGLTRAHVHTWRDLKVPLDRPFTDEEMRNRW